VQRQAASPDLTDDPRPDPPILGADQLDRRSQETRTRGADPLGPASLQADVLERLLDGSTLGIDHEEVQVSSLGR
jgi:hypothetical protein